MANQFISEYHVYQILNQAGIKTPRNYLLCEEETTEPCPFVEGEAVVIKGLADNLWHKSDLNAVHFCDYSLGKASILDEEMKVRLNPQYPWIGTLITEKISICSPSGVPSEIFVSLTRGKCCSAVISIGFGGLLTEEWAKELKAPLLVWPSSVYSPLEAYDEFSSHWLGRLLLGNARQQKALITKEKLLIFFECLWSLGKIMADRNLTLLEINPFVITTQGEIIALDGVAINESEEHIDICPVPLNHSQLLSPKSIAIAGVSNKQGNIGAMILNNINESNIPKQNLRIIKADIKYLQGIECLPNIEALIKNPVDILILALPAKSTIEMVKQLCEQGSGAHVVYLVAGGIGDSADTLGLSKELEDLITAQRNNGLWCPALIGPNGLGMINASLQLNTLFIPQEKLKVQFCEDAEVALVSQSGAFLITRLSRDNSLKLKYGFSIGNQIDMKFSDFIALITKDKSVRVLGLYVEGFADGDVCAISKLIKKFHQEKRHVLIYKGGRSERGKVAAAGHTGAMMGDYQMQKRLLTKSGAIFVETFNQFNAVLKWLSAYPLSQHMRKISIVTNAGYETVGSMDILGDTHSARLYELSANNQIALQKVLIDNQLDNLVVPANPLDLTPMAGEKAYFDSVEAMINFGADTILLGLVPLTNQLETEALNQAQEFAQSLKNLARKSDSCIGIVLDVGLCYQEYKDVFQNEDLPVFDSMDMAVLGVNILYK
jgi:acyl-CoA synthetase (NDP forming)